jgi:predicted nuclease of predicted toxin-antitoxin system
MALLYHLDENMPHAIANGLQQRGVDVTTTSDAGLIGASDEEQLAHALAENRVLVGREPVLRA